MLPPVRLSAAQHDQLAQLLLLDQSKIDRAVSSLSKLPRATLTLKELTNCLSPALERDGARIIATLLVSLGSYSRRFSVNAVVTVDALARGLRSYSNWSAVQHDQWEKSFRKNLVRMLDFEAVKIVAKTTDLAFDYANSFVSARILTDIRPVFSDDHSEIVGTIASNILRIEYAPGSDDVMNISILLDVDELDKLRLACEEALRKTTVVHAFMERPKKLPIINAGEDLYDAS